MGMLRFDGHDMSHELQCGYASMAECASLVQRREAHLGVPRFLSGFRRGRRVAGRRALYISDLVVRARRCMLGHGLPRTPVGAPSDRRLSKAGGPDRPDLGAGRMTDRSAEADVGVLGQIPRSRHVQCHDGPMQGQTGGERTLSAVHAVRLVLCPRSTALAAAPAAPNLARSAHAGLGWRARPGGPGR